MKAMKPAIYTEDLGESGRRLVKHRLTGGLAAFICLTGLLFNLTASSLIPPVNGRIRGVRLAIRPERLNYSVPAKNVGWNVPIHVGSQWVFSQPFDTETPDIDPAMVRSKKIAAFFIAGSAMRRRASSPASRISTPLYLVHKSLLC
jgi:hypothetical protein